MKKSKILIANFAFLICNLHCELQIPQFVLKNPNQGDGSGLGS